MTDTQLYFAVGLPTFAVLIGIIVNGMQFASLHGRMGALDSRFAGFEVRIASLEAKFEVMLTKLVDIDNRVSRLEDRWPGR